MNDEDEKKKQVERKEELIEIAHEIDSRPVQVLQHLTLNQIITITCQLARLVLQDNNIPTAGKLAAHDDTEDDQALETLKTITSGLIN